MESLKVFFDKMESKPLYLNHTKIKSIQVCLDPASLPNVKPVYKLNAIDHRCSITFSKETMQAISDKSSEISSCLSREDEKLFLINNELKVFSERMHGRCAVCFLSMQGTRINMMDNTFSKMIRSTSKLATMHNRLQHKVNKTAKNLKQFLNILSSKYSQCNVNNPDFQSFLQQLQQSASSLCGQEGSLSNASNLNDSDSSDDNNSGEDEDEDEDEDGDDSDHYFERRRRRHFGYDEYDDEEDMDDDF